MLNGTVFYFFKICIYLLFLERGREGEKEGKNINVWLPLERPLLGTWPATQVCALTGNQTGNPLVCRSALNPLSHTSQGCLFFFTVAFFVPVKHSIHGHSVFCI